VSWGPTGQWYSPTLESIRIELGEGSAGGTATRTLINTVVETDDIYAFENVRGSNRYETIVGNSGDNVIEARGGNDVVDGGFGDDTLSGGNDVDTVSFESWDPTGLYIESPLQSIRIELGENGWGAATWTYGGFPIESDDLSTFENVRGSNRSESIFGNSGVNTLEGRGGNDVLDGRGGADTMRGGFGSDTYMVDNAGDTIIENGGQGIDTVRSSVSYTLTAGADVELLATTSDAGTGAINLTGNNNGNVVRGNAGNNIIAGAGGDDELAGLGGQDRFLFNTALDAATNVDEITDFNVTDDTILLDNAVFAALTDGGLLAGQFVTGAAAQDPGDRIIYNSNTGALLYDSDGLGGLAPIQFAELTPGLNLSAADFLVV
jgi:serralysin